MLSHFTVFADYYCSKCDVFPEIHFGGSYTTYSVFFAESIGYLTEYKCEIYVKKMTNLRAFGDVSVYCTGFQSFSEDLRTTGAVHVIWEMIHFDFANR